MRAFPLLLVLGVLATGCSERKTFTKTDETQIRRALDEWRQALVAREWAKVAALYTEDAVLLPPHAKAVTGRKGIETFLAAFPPIEGFTITVDEIRGDGDLAYARGTYDLRLRIPGESEAVTEVGKFLEVRVRGDGSWPIVRDIFNSDTPVR